MNKEVAWDIDTKEMFNGWSLSLVNRRSNSDQSVQYIGLARTNSDCDSLSKHVYLYNTYRHKYNGT